jgi:hypothetical protein
MGLDYAAAANAFRADSGSLVSSVDYGSNPLKIGVPTPLGNVMSMTDVIAKEWSFAANVTTCCHKCLPMPSQKRRTIANLPPSRQTQNLSSLLKFGVTNTQASLLVPCAYN